MKKIIIPLFVLLLSGCSTNFAYNNASWLVYWYLDDYVELNDQQEDQFDEMLSTWMDWHRSTELPKYQAHLEEIINDIKKQQIDARRIAYHREKSRAHWVRARAYVAPDIVTLSKTLNEEQITQLFAKLEKDNVEKEEEDAEISELTPSEQAKKWIKRNQKGAKKWIGKLNEEQKAHITRFRDRFKKTGSDWLRYKRSYQQALHELLAAADRSSVFEDTLLELILYPEVFKSDAFIEAFEANNKASAEYLIGMLERADKKQINSLLEEIADLKKDIANLQSK